MIFLILYILDFFQTQNIRIPMKANRNLLAFHIIENIRMMMASGINGGQVKVYFLMIHSLSVYKVLILPTAKYHLRITL